MTDISHPASAVLLVDDDQFLVSMYGMKFAQQGFNVQTCLSVNDAIKALQGGFVPDVVLFDIIMPEHDGFSFLQTLKDEHLAQGAIKIALTNQSDDAERTKAVELGADQYVVKATMSPLEVVGLVQEWLAKHK